MQEERRKTMSLTPKGERGEADYRDRSGVLRYTMTSSPSRDVFYLYAVSGEKITRLGKGSSPIELEKKFEVAKHLSQPAK